MLEQVSSACDYVLQSQATAASSVTWFCKRLLATFFTISGQVEQKEPVEVPPAEPKSSLKIQKRGRSGSTPNLKQTDSKPVVTNEKRHSLAASTFPRMSTPNKQQQDLAGETNGLVTLPRKGNHGCIA